jgi:hypothetical protein
MFVAFKGVRRLSSVPLPPRWVKLATEDLGGKPVDTLIRQSPEGISVKPLYTAEDTQGIEVQQIPGEKVTGFNTLSVSGYLPAPNMCRLPRSLIL